MRFFMPDFEHLNAQDFHHVLEASRGVCVVFFTHSLCTSCRAWKQLLQAYREDRPGVRIFEVDAEVEMALTHEFEIFHLPALFLYHDGRYHAPLQAEASLAALHATITALLDEPARDMP